MFRSIIPGSSEMGSIRAQCGSAGHGRSSSVEQPASGRSIKCKEQGRKGWPPTPGTVAMPGEWPREKSHRRSWSLATLRSHHFFWQSPRERIREPRQDHNGHVGRSAIGMSWANTSNPDIRSLLVQGSHNRWHVNYRVRDRPECSLLRGSHNQAR